MSTIFSDDLFIKSELYTSDKKNKIICTLRDSQNKYVADLLRQDNRGNLSGRLVEPVEIPSWLVPGTILYGTVQSIKMTLTYEGVVQSRIEGLTEQLGAKLRFSFVSTTEFQ